MLRFTTGQTRMDVLRVGGLGVLGGTLIATRRFRDL